MLTEKFSTEMQKTGLGDKPFVAVAVSGGGDSMALALLLEAWVRERGGRLLALTVDHGLRAESRAEAERVGAVLRARGMAHDILTWQGEKPATHIQEKAREARYALLLEACRRKGCHALALAHHLEDQIETFWMRLAHGSGLDGLAAMAPVHDREGVKMIRPLLGFSRASLRDVCKDAGIGWVEDPSNGHEKYLRVRLRQFEDVLAQEGLTPERLVRTLQKLDTAKEALRFYVQKAFEECVMLREEGYAILDIATWREAPSDIRRRVLSRLLKMLSGSVYPVDAESLESDILCEGFRGRTLSACDIFPSGGKIVFCREAAVMEPRKKIEGKTLWDRRFVVSGFSGVEIGGLGEEGLSILRKQPHSLRRIEDLPFKVKKVLPALWQGGNLVAVPHVSYLSPEAGDGLPQGRIAFLYQDLAA